MLFIAAVIIGVSSLWYTNILVRKFAAEEKKRIELWAEAQEQVIKSDENLDFFLATNELMGNYIRFLPAGYELVAYL